MKALDFSDVAQLINYSRITEIDSEPTLKEQGKWALYKGVNKVSTFSYPFYILYLYSDFTKESSISASKAVTQPSATQIIYAPSVKPNFVEELVSLTKPRGNIAGVNDLKKYLLSFLQNQIKAYTDKLTEEIRSDFFIEPHYNTPGNYKPKTPSPILSLLIDNSDDVNEGALGILLAEPGQGKTYSTKNLTTELISRGYIPIYIHSAQWIGMRSDELSSLYKTIMYSFRYFNAPIDWIEGKEEEFINISLKLGLFRVIFDGFDEYILWNNGKIKAQDAINNLHSLVEQSNSRILVTSRTTFWYSNVLDETGFKKLFKYSIVPFDSNHAKKYFLKRFPENERVVNKATELFGILKNSGNSEFSKSFMGRGIILTLIADLCSDEVGVSTYDGSISVMQWLMKALCQREEKRQRLPINDEQQLTILRIFAEDKAKGALPNSKLLRDIIEISCDKLTEEEINGLISDAESRSLHDHPLITKSPLSDVWNFKHEQIEFNLLSEQILGYIRTGNHSLLRSFFSSFSFEGGLLDNLNGVICEQLNISRDTEYIHNSYSKIIKGIMFNYDVNKLNPRNHDSLLTLATKILISVINKTIPNNSFKNERCAELLFYLQSKEIRGLQFSDTISKYDFSNISFINCRFDDVVWSNCKFNHDTVFKNCYFVGGEVYNSEGFGKANFDDSSFDKEADMVISHQRVKQKEKIITREDIQRDIELFVKRFIPKEGVYKSIAENNLLRGSLGTSPYKDDLFDVMTKYIIEEHKISQGSMKGFNIKMSARASITHFMTNGVFSGELAKAYNELCKKLKI